MKLLGYIGGFVLAALVRGLVLMQLWTWFVVKQFGQRPLQFWEALGVSLLVSYLVMPVAKKSDDPYPWAISVALAIFAGVLVLTFGFVYSRFL